MKKKIAAKASRTPAAAKAAAPIPPRLAETVTSVFASSISERISVDMSAMALLASVPTEGSAGPAGRPASGVVETLWATGGSSLIGAGWRAPPMIVPHDRRARVPWPHQASPRAREGPSGDVAATGAVVDVRDRSLAGRERDVGEQQVV